MNKFINIKVQMKLLIATTNAGKKKEFFSLLQYQGFELLFPDDVGIKMEIEETGSSYLENAVLKAESLSNLSGLPTLADDTGLEVAALNGRPGLYSARYAQMVVKTEVGRRNELLKELGHFPRPWLARFVCVVALAIPNNPTVTFNGEIQGEIIPEERGEFGFGYDRIFFIPGLEQTMAELDLDVKNRCSHRALAVNQAKDFLLTRS
jgi:XTP/dITP diphosphohydrolase